MIRLWKICLVLVRVGSSREFISCNFFGWSNHLPYLPRNKSNKKIVIGLFITNFSWDFYICLKLLSVLKKRHVPFTWYQNRSGEWVFLTSWWVRLLACVPISDGTYPRTNNICLIFIALCSWKTTSRAVYDFLVLILRYIFYFTEKRRGFLLKIFINSDQNGFRKG